MRLHARQYSDLTPVMAILLKWSCEHLNLIIFKVVIGVFKTLLCHLDFLPRLLISAFLTVSGRSRRCQDETKYDCRVVSINYGQNNVNGEI
uniref:Uncharacterized protein n=1 Tax=Anguilla anguilla TaxID=7936 RepID=A0A0E9X192_ANGAN